MAKLTCPEDENNNGCGSNDTWATYICTGGSNDAKGGGHTKPVEWIEEAIGPEPDGVPNRRPCPGCQANTAAAYATCAPCGYSWTWDDQGNPVPA